MELKGKVDKLERLPAKPIAVESDGAIDVIGASTRIPEDLVAVDAGREVHGPGEVQPKS